MPVERIESPEIHVVVEVGGAIVADTTNPAVLYETGLPPRYYIPMGDVRSEYLTPTDTSTHCPYKGDARYWSINVDGTELIDAVWGYDEPIPASAAINRHVCFYPEKVNLTVDGSPLPVS